MADVLRIKRRPVGGAAGPPSSLAASEIAFNEQTNILYYGGGNSVGLATSIFPIGGPGAFLSLISGGTVTGTTNINAQFNAGGINLNAVLPTSNSTGMGVGWNYSAGLGETDLFNYYSPSTANSFSFYQYTTATTATRIAMMSLTGINATAIGATTASTGSFTTLAASGTLGVGGQISSTGGLTFGAAVAGSSSTLSRHIELYNPGYGFSITGGRLNIVTGLTTVLVVGSTDVGTITSTGLNSTAIGATTPSTGSFTTLAASGTATTAAINAGGIVTVGTDTVAQNLILNGPVVSRVFRFQTAGLNRWHFNCNNTAEGGANAGSNLDISCYDDAGATLMSPVIRITRSTQTTNFFGPLTAISAPVGTTDITVATTLFAARLLGYLNNAATIPDADTALTVAQVAQRFVRFATALTADRTYTLPSTNQRNWVFWNNTTGGYNLIFTLGGNTISIPPGYRAEVFNDAASVYAINCLPAQSVRIGPGDRNAVLITTGATAAAATTIEATGTGAINWITGLGFGTAVAPGGVADLTRHLALYSTTYGFSVTSLRLNYNAPVSAAHVFLVNGTDVGSFTSAGAQLIGTPTAPTAAATVNNTQIATTAYVTSAIAAYADDIGRNYVHNGLFRIWQRGSVSFTTHLNFTADRWQMWKGADTMTVTRQTLIDTERTQIGDEDAAYALQAAVVGTAAAGDNAVMQQRIEGVRRLSNKQITVSFYAVATAGTPKIGISYDQIFGGGGSPSAQVSGAGTSVTITNAAWARYSVSLTLPSCSGKTLGTNGDDCTAINLWLSSGATNNTRAGLIGVQTVTAKFWGVQVEIGALTPMEKIDQSLDWNNCQRFYQATVIGLGGYAAAGALFGYYVTFPVAMQKVPTVNIASPTYTNASAGAANSISQTSFFAQATATALGTCSFLYTYLASADL